MQRLSGEIVELKQHLEHYDRIQELTQMLQESHRCPRGVWVGAGPALVAWGWEEPSWCCRGWVLGRGVSALTGKFLSVPFLRKSESLVAAVFGEV